jgi:hypothetical protein
MLRPAFVAFVACSAFAGCSANDPPPVIPPVDAGFDAGADDAPGDTADACSAPDTGDFPCDVAAVIEICQNCHRDPPVRGAPFPFLRYEDVQQLYFGTTRRWERMSQVIEPDDPIHMPPRTATDIPQPNDQQLDTLRTWFRACTPPEPEGMGCDKSEGDGGDP